MAASPKPALTYALAVLAGVAGAALGAFVAAWLGHHLTTLAGVSDHEGQRGLLVVFGIAPIGGLIGLLVGAWLTLRYHGGYRGFAALAGRTLAVAAGVAATAALGLWQTW